MRTTLSHKHTGQVPQKVHTINIHPTRSCCSVMQGASWEAQERLEKRGKELEDQVAGLVAKLSDAQEQLEAQRPGGQVRQPDSVCVCMCMCLCVSVFVDRWVGGRVCQHVWPRALCS